MTYGNRAIPSSRPCCRHNNPPEVERETGKQITQKMAELEGRRSAVIAACTAAVHAGHDEIGRREYALLRKVEALRRDEVQRCLDGSDGKDLGRYH